MDKKRAITYYEPFEVGRSAAILPPPEPGDTRQGAGLHSIEAGATLGAVQSVITAAFVGAAIGIVALIAGWSKPGLWGLAAFVISGAVCWLLLLGRWWDLTRIETASGIDINGDGIVGKRAPDILRVEVTSGRSTTIAELPGAKKLPEFARSVLGGAPLSEKYWSGSGALFSINEYRQLRDILIARGLMRWVNPDAHEQGLSLTAPGVAVFEALGSSKILPSQVVDIDQER